MLEDLQREVVSIKTTLDQSAGASRLMAKITGLFGGLEKGTIPEPENPAIIARVIERTRYITPLVYSPDHARSHRISTPIHLETGRIV